MDKILFIWDFHGTLERDNVKAVKEIIDRVFHKFGINKAVSLDEVSKHYGLSWMDYCRILWPEVTHQKYLAMKSKVGRI